MLEGGLEQTGTSPQAEHWEEEKYLHPSAPDPELWITVRWLEVAGGPCLPLPTALSLPEAWGHEEAAEGPPLAFLLLSAWPWTFLGFCYAFVPLPLWSSVVAASLAQQVAVSLTRAQGECVL